MNVFGEDEADAESVNDAHLDDVGTLLAVEPTRRAVNAKDDFPGERDDSGCLARGRRGSRRGQRQRCEKESGQ
jgi:hypothetical protein